MATFTPRLSAQDCCDQGDKPNSLTMVYTGESCSATNTSQELGKYDCDDFSGGPGGTSPVYIVSSDKEDGTGKVYFTGTVNAGSSFTANSSNAGEDDFSSNTYFLIYSSQGGQLLQRVQYHTSCSAPIVTGEQVGSLFVQNVTFKNNVNCGPATPPGPPEECPVPVVTINSSQGQNNTTVCQNDPIVFVTDAPDCPDVTLTWDFGAGATPATATGPGPHTVTYDAPGTATISLTADNDCEGGVGTTVCPPPPPPPIGSDCCESISGKPKRLTVQYTGESCGATNTSQDPGKYECTDFSGGPGGDPTVFITVTENEDGGGKQYFSGTVDINTSFTADAGLAGDNEFKSKVFFRIYSSQGGQLLQLVNYHTSCSAPLVPGENVGSILIESAEWNDGSFCDVSGGSTGGGSGGSDCCDQGDKPDELTFTYNGESCANTSTNQDPGKYECDDFNGGPNSDPTVYIVASENENGGGKIYFSGNVALGSSFTATSANAGDAEFKSKTYFNIYSSQGGTLLQRINWHTSCSAPLVTGDQIGALVLENVEFKNGVSCGPPPPTGPDCLDCEETVTLTVTIIDCICIDLGGDSDGDLVCDDLDCAPLDPFLPAPPGTLCDDGNPNTFNDVILADSCSCAGTPPNVCDLTVTILNKVCDGKGTSTTTDDTYTFTVLVTGTNTSSNFWSGSYSNPFLGSFFIPPTPLGTPINLGPFPAGEFTSTNTNPPTTVFNGLDIALTVQDIFDPSCNESVTVTSTGPCSPPEICINVTFGGTIGFSPNCAITTEVCDEPVPFILNCTSPSGGDGPLEIIWLKAINNPNCYPPTTTVDNLDNDPFWSIIPGETGLTLNPGTVEQQTCFLRCVRRDGCVTYIESNIISVDVEDGCGIGDPDCANIGISAGAGTINITGLDGAPFSSVHVFNSNWGTEYTCFANCSATTTVNVSQGSYFVFVKYYDAGYNLVCEVQQTVLVNGSDPCANAGGDSDGDGVCNNQDCAPFNPALPATPGTSCNDGNANTTNDVIQADGCTCAGTPIIDPCAGQGGDSDGDGVCNNQDCAPFNPALPATPGTACNDGNANTTNDMIQADGCTCAGTPVSGNPCDNVTVTTGSGNITVNGSSGAPVVTVQVFDANWQTVYSCGANSTCSDPAMISLAPGNYCVSVKFYTAGWASLMCEVFECVTVQNGGDPCAGQGGDSDGDGVCDAVDCAPANPALPATPGTSCNDGNANTTNDVIQADGCTCAGTPIVDPCAGQGGDSDGDGVCDNVDCAPANPALPATPGTACNDNDPNTTNDVIQADGCTCAGTPGGGGGSPDCNSITISTGPGMITASGLDGAPVTSLHVFDAVWSPVFTCFGDCQPSESVNVTAGNYYVKVVYYNAQYMEICQVLETVSVSSAALANSQFSFEVAKHEEHVELLWLHNKGEEVVQYVIEHSSDGHHFESIQDLPSRGGTSSELYQGYDLHPAIGDNHYRVRMDMIDGNVTYSDIRLVHYADLIDFVLFPNPADRFVKINLEAVLDKEDVTITLFNNLGVEMKRFELEKVYSRYHQLDIRDLREGHYIVWLNVPGRKPLAKTLVIGKL